jgi:aminopeptidase
VDERWGRLADILIGYSTRTRPDERVLIAMTEAETLPLVRAVYEAAVKAGAYPHVQFASAYLERALLRHGTQAQLAWVPEPEAQGMAWADVYVGLRGARNPHEFADVAADRLAAHRRATGKVSALRTELTRWVLVRVPNEAFAQQAEMALDEMMTFFFRATLRDWEAESRTYHRLAERFQGARAVRLVGAETDLRFSTEGRRYVVGGGEHNMPDGEIFTAPVEDSVDGYVSFEFPGVYGGRQIGGIRLEFRQGEVVRATASTNEALLHELLAMDAGARRIGEFGVGTNFGIDRFCHDILYDEKIGGTVHLAFGRAYRECGGSNQSALHWDIVKDLRHQGAIYLDGTCVFESGQFVV